MVSGDGILCHYEVTSSHREIAKLLAVEDAEVADFLYKHGG
ncbi:MAG: hypothetical protein VX413_04575 [Verrucomicrobiota bacterium]|nr:hypothetical protein [Verrucomicrobiota bacterium]